MDLAKRIPIHLVLAAVLATALGCNVDSDDLGRTRDVVVVGAGIAGLTAAHMLKDQDVLVLEKEPIVGGRALSGQHEGVAYAKGTEYLGEVDGALSQVVKDLGIEPIEIPSPMDAKIQDGKVFIGDDNIARMLIDRAGLAEYNRFVSVVQETSDMIDDGKISDPEIRRLDRMSTLDWFKENRFHPIFSDFYNVSCRGLFGASLAESSALCMIPEIGFDYVQSEPINHLSKVNNTSKAVEAHSGAYTFKGGISALCEGIAKSLGERVKLGCTVVDISRNASGFSVSFTDPGGQTHTVASKSVILAVPAPVSLKLASNVLSGEQKDLLATVQYAHYMTVALFSRTPIFDQAFDLAVPDGMFFTDLYPGGWAERNKANRQGSHVLSAYVAPKSYKDDLLSITNESVIQRVLGDLERLFPGSSLKVTGHDIYRFPYSYPIMTVGASERMERLGSLDGNGLFLAGDYLVNPTFDAAAESGASAAEKCEKHLASKNQ